MKLETYKNPESSFLSIEKDMSIIIDYILKNDNLKKLLFYTSKDALERAKLDTKESLALISKNIKMVPKFEIDKDILNYLVIQFDNFVQNTNNPEFRDNLIEFDILCHFNQWQLNDFKLRPYRIAAELDTILNNKRLTGVGTLEFFTATKINFSEEYAGICLMYKAIHGEEDHKFAPNPNDEQQLIENFNKIFNNDEE